MITVNMDRNDHTLWFGKHITQLSAISFLFLPIISSFIFSCCSLIRSGNVYKYSYCKFATGFKTIIFTITACLAMLCDGSNSNAFL